MIKKRKLQTPNLVDKNIAQIGALYPGCVTETCDRAGQIKLAVDFDQLRQELSDQLIDGAQERYHLNWPGKRQALLTANAPITKALRPKHDESVAFDTTQNLFIEGDNLDALKLLQQSYHGQVKMIYIDPPYNTGNDFIYRDNFTETSDAFLQRTDQKDPNGNRLVTNTESNGRFHSDWLSMMYPRLKLARNLLRDDGVIFISIDDNEVHNIRKIGDEVFGEKNFIATLVWKKKYTGGKHTKGYVDLHEYIVVFSKSINHITKIFMDRPEKEKAKFIEKDEFLKDRGMFYVRPLKSNLAHRKTLIYPITAPDGSVLETQWLVAKDTFENLIKEKRVEFRKKQNGSYQIYRKYYEKDNDGTVKPPSIIDKFPNTEAKNELKKLFDIKEGRDNIFYTVKPINFINFLLIPHDDSNAIVLDFFAGSATTAHAVMQLNAEDGGNRRFIMVQIPEVTAPGSEAYKAGYTDIAAIGKERIRRAGQKILAAQCHPSWNRDVGFRVLTIATSNRTEVYSTASTLTQAALLDAVDSIKPERDTPGDLLFQVLVDLGMNLSLPICSQTIANKHVLFVDDNALIACFDRGITENLAKALAGFTPRRVMFCDHGFVSDAVRINVGQIFKQLSPNTTVQSI